MTAFASTDELGDFLGEELTGTRLTQAAMHLELASADIRSWCRQRLDYVEDDEIDLRGTRDWELVLPERPVVALGEIKLDGLVLAPGLIQLAGDQIIRSGGWAGPGSTVHVTYSHGFDPIPEDIRGVCLRMASRAVQNPQGIRQESVGTYSVTYGGDSPGSSDEGLFCALERYRRRTASPRLATERYTYPYPVANA